MKKLLIFVLFGCALAACSGGGGGHGGGGLIPGPSPSSAGGPTPTPAPTQAPSGTVYVGTFGPAYQITTYDQSGNSKPVTGSFSGLQSNPEIAYDSANSLLYTTNLLSPNVYTVAAFNTQGQAQSLTGSWAGLTNVGDSIAYDPHNGFIYVPNYTSGAWTMLTYDSNGNPQSQAPGAWAALAHPKSIAFDTQNNLFYIANDNGVQIWTESGNDVTGSGFANLPTGQGVTVQSVLYDPHNSTIYVSESNSTILTYDQYGSVKSQSAWAGVFLPGRMAFDPDNNEIYMIQLTGPFKVTVYDESGNQLTGAGKWQSVPGQATSIAIVP